MSLEKETQDMCVDMKKMEIESEYETDSDEEVNVIVDIMSEDFKHINELRLKDEMEKKKTVSMPFAIKTRGCNRVRRTGDKWTYCDNIDCTYAHNIRELNPIPCTRLQCHGYGCYRKHQWETLGQYCMKNSIILPDVLPVKDGGYKTVEVKFDMLIPANATEKDIRLQIIEMVRSGNYKL